MSKLTRFTAVVLLAGLGATAQAGDKGARTAASDDLVALRAETAELKTRIDALKAQKADAERLIALKTARLQALEKEQAGR